jgi:hypothetical protein
MSKEVLQLQQGTSASQMISPFESKPFKQQFEIALTDEFLKYEAKTKEMIEISSKISINNSEELLVAKSRLLDVKSWVTKLIDAHKKIKSPLLEITRMLDGKKKGIETSFESAKASLETKITLWETVAKRAEAARIQAEIDEKNKINEIVLKETERLNRLVSNVKAMLYGGKFVNDSGESIKPGCFTVADVEQIEGVVNRNLPGPAMFRAETQPAYIETMTMVTDMITARKESLQVTDGQVLSGKELSILAETSSVVLNQQQRLQREDEKLDRALDNTNKGFRREIQYDVFDLGRVPREFLTIDTEKLNAYKVEHRQRILEGLQNGTIQPHGFIDGIRFYVHQTSIVR